MISKTLAYMTAFVYIIKGVIQLMLILPNSGLRYKQDVPQAIAQQSE